MLNSDLKYIISISFIQKIDGILLTIIDSDFIIVFSGSNRIEELELQRGIYKLKASYIDYNQEYILIVDQDNNFNFHFDYPIVAPVSGFKFSQDYYTENSEIYSKTSTNGNCEQGPNFFLFVSKLSKENFPELYMDEVVNEFSVTDRNNNSIQLNNYNSVLSNEFGWLAFSAIFEEGLFFLKCENNSSIRIFPFYIFENVQTQFFIRYSPVPDFKNCIFFYNSDMCFNRRGSEYIVLDKILFAYKNYENYSCLTDGDKVIINQHSYLVSLVRILQKSIRISSPDFTNQQPLALPDLNLLNNRIKKYNFNELIPVISALMTKYSINNQIGKMEIQANSLIDRIIDHLNYDLFWTNFSRIEPETNPVAKMKINTTKFSTPPIPKIKTFKNITKNIKRMGESSEFMPLFNLNIDSDSITELKVDNDFQLSEKIKPQLNVEKFIHVKMINDADNDTNNDTDKDTYNDKESEISSIAKQLRIPETQVIRQYTKYKNIYNKMKF